MWLLPEHTIPPIGRACLVVCLDGKYGGNSNEPNGLVESGNTSLAGSRIATAAAKTGEVVWSDGRDSAKPFEI